MRRRCATVVVAAAVGVCAALLSGVSAAAASPPAAGAAAQAGAVDSAGQLPGLAALSPESISAVSCASAGNCGAVGSYGDSSGSQGAGLVVSERNGRWGVPRVVARSVGPPGTALAGVMSVSCAVAGGCSAGGYYEAGGMSAFVVGETDGRWGAAAKVGGATGDSEVDSVSCAAAGNCTAAGSDGPSGEQAFVVDETDGAWGQAQPIPGLARLNKGFAGIGSVSCGSAGTCSAGGYYTGRSGTQAFVVSEKNGTWGRAQQVPGSARLNTGGAAGIVSVSCASAGTCSAGGYYTGRSGTQAFVVSEKNGTWGRAQQVPGSARLNTGGAAGIVSVSCATVGNCAAGGDYSASVGGGVFVAGVFVVSEKSGIWGAAAPVPGLGNGGDASMQSLSCGSAGNCSAGGEYGAESCCWGHAFVVSERHGTWGRAQQVRGLARPGAGAASINSVSCGSAGSCSAGGFIFINPPTGADHAFVVSQKDGIWGAAHRLRSQPS